MLAGSPTALTSVAAALLVAAAFVVRYGFLRFRDRVRTDLKGTPDIRVTASTPGGLTVTVSGYPLQTSLIGPYLRRAAGAQIADGLRSRLPVMRVPPLPLIRDRVLPLLKRRDRLPPSRGYVAANHVLRRFFDEEIIIAYAFEGQSRITYVTAGMLEAWGVTEEELHALAVENLRAKTRHVLEEIGGPRPDYIALDGFDAARLLVADLLIPPGMADPVLAIPHEHALLVRDRSAAASLPEEAQQAATGSSLPLTTRLYRWTPHGPAPVLTV